MKGETYAAKYAYENPDDEIGSVDELGWYGKFSGTIKGSKKVFHIIVNEDSQGFVSSSFFDTEKQLEEAWKETVIMYEEFYEDQEAEQDSSYGLLSDYDA